MRMSRNHSRIGLVVLPVHLTPKTANTRIRLSDPDFEGRQNRAMIFDAGHRLVNRLPDPADIRPIQWHIETP